MCNRPGPERLGRVCRRKLFFEVAATRASVASMKIAASAEAHSSDPEDPKETELTAPLLTEDSEVISSLQERVRALEETPDAATLHELAKREPNSFHQATIY